MNKKIALAFGLTLILMLSGCNQSGSVSLSKVNDSNWAVVGVGQDKGVALHLLGDPDLIDEVSVLGVTTERLTWISHFPDRRYQLDLVLGRVVAKKTSSNS